MQETLLSFPQIRCLIEQLPDHTFIRGRVRFVASKRSSVAPVIEKPSLLVIRCHIDGMFSISIQGRADSLEVQLEIENGKLSSFQNETVPLTLFLLKRNWLRSQNVEVQPSRLIAQSSWSAIEAASNDEAKSELVLKTLDEKSPFSLAEQDWILVNQIKCSLTEETYESDVIDDATNGLISRKISSLEGENQMNLENNQRGFFSSPPKLNAKQLTELKKHVVNLNQGQFSQDGEFTSSLQDVKAIFGKHLPNWIEQQHPDKEKVDVVLYSHGGLTNEGWGLATAAHQLEFWKKNGIYPIFFVWETGFLETLWQMFRGSQARVRPAGSRTGRGISDWFDEAEDKAWERAVRFLGGPKVWGGMKASAEKAFQDHGDGIHVLDQMVEFWSDCELEVGFHAVGHSAGSIFLSHAIAAADRTYEGFPKFETAHFLAPAITTQLFRDTIKPLIGRGEADLIKHLSIFTMSDFFERDDTVGPYDKSLLYLIYHALEPEKETHILGMEHSLMNEPDMADFFGMTNRDSLLTDVILSVTEDDAEPTDRSLSTKHGDFDDDPATMESVACRILGTEKLVENFPKSRGDRGTSMPALPRQSASNNPSYQTETRSSSFNMSRGGSSRNRKAVCIGVNSYPKAPLFGCENDARNWSELFSNRGFDVNLLLSDQATRDGILDSLEALIGNSVPGDSLAIMYAGHGTQIDDVDGDEANGDTPNLDEALVPVDHRNAGLIIDDDLKDIFSRVPNGVSLTVFMDCCHSGTNTRLLFRSQDSLQGTARFLPADQEMKELHRQLRGNRSSRNANHYQGANEILFSACRSREVAFESRGSGDFTRNALKVLRDHPNLTCRQFIDQVKDEFGPSRQQTPELWCDPNYESSQLLDSSLGVQASEMWRNEGDDTRQALIDIKNILERYL